MPKKFYITTTTPYVNGEPHIGFAKEIIFADVIARYHRQMGEEVRFNTGTDEHGQKIYEKALEMGKAPQAYVDELAPRFEALKGPLNLSFTDFSRTSSDRHKKAAQELWRRCDANGYIYKAKQKIKYCVGCELEKTDSELEHGRCPIHLDRDLETREEENYFFKFSAFQDKLIALYNNAEHFVVPDFRLEEIKKFVSEGLRDFSISRLKSKMSWGVPVPGDDEHVMFVWFDALVIYISPLGWPDQADFGGWWPGMQVCGKDNLRQQTAIWQAMLMAAGLPNSTQVAVLGFITSGGTKMSKSLGNVIDPIAMVAKYGTDALRYFLMREITSFEDGDFTEAVMQTRYTGDLANNLGNLVSRVATLKSKIKSQKSNLDSVVTQKIETTKNEYRKALNDFKFHEALARLWELYTFANGYINEKAPWKTNDAQAVASISYLLQESAVLLEPFLPATAQKIRSGSPGILFPRLILA